MTTTPTTTTTTPPSTPILHVINVDYLNESWCELQYKSGCSSTGSISHLNHSVNPEVLEKLLQEAQKDIQSPLTTLPQSDSNSSLYFHDLFSSASSSSIKQINDIQTATITTTSHSISNQNASNSKHIKTTITLIDNKTNKLNLNSSNSIIPILNSAQMMESGAYDYNYSYSDEDVDLEYVEDDTCDEANTYENKTIKMESGAAPGPAVSTPCQNCIKHKKQIDMLIEKQIQNEKELIKLKNEFEIKLLNKSLEITSRSESSSSTPTSNHKSTSTSPIMSTSTPTPTSASQNQTVTNQSSSDWIKYFSSRPQAQPPKEWNFVHPNSSKSKLKNVCQVDQDLYNPISTKAVEQSAMNSYNCSYNNIVNSFKVLSKENIGKLIFTHMASFIVGATLMFLVLKRHLNLKSSVYFI